MERLNTIILLALFAFVSVSVSGVQSVEENAGCRYLAQVPGGCPNITACTEVCTPCYRGVGRIVVECIAPSGPIYWWQCRCNFKDGAPCPPTGPPTCPKPPDHHMVHANPAHWLVLNQTLAVLVPPNKRPF